MKKFWKNPWTIGICTTLIGFLLTVLYDLLKGKHVFTTIHTVLTVIWNGIITFLTFDLKVWWVLLGVAILLLALVVYSKALDRKDMLSNNKGSAVFEYTQDSIDGWKWTWEWRKNYDGKYGIENLRLLCSYCDTPLVNEDGSYGPPFCIRCKRRFPDNVPDYKNIEVLILDNARRGLFPSSKQELNV